MEKKGTICLGVGDAVAVQTIKNCIRTLFFMLDPQLGTTIMSPKNLQPWLQLLDLFLSCSTQNSSGQFKSVFFEGNSKNQAFLVAETDPYPPMTQEWSLI